MHVCLCAAFGWRARATFFFLPLYTRKIFVLERNFPLSLESNVSRIIPAGTEVPDDCILSLSVSFLFEPYLSSRTVSRADQAPSYFSGAYWFTSFTPCCSLVDVSPPPPFHERAGGS